MGICCCSLAGTQACVTCSANGILNTIINTYPFTWVPWQPPWETKTWVSDGTKIIDTSEVITKDDVRKILKEELDNYKRVSELKPGQVVLTKTENLSFEEILPYIKSGKWAARSDWNGKNQYVCMLEGGQELNTLTFRKPFLVLFNAQGEYVPWVPSMGDLFSKKWKLVDESTIPKTISSTVSDYHGPITGCTVCSKDVKNVTYTAK